MVNTGLTVRHQQPTRLMEAVQDHDAAAVRSRIGAGDDITTRDSYGQTALHWAAKYDSLEIVQLLLDAGADPTAKDDDGDTPLTNATRNAHPAVVELLTRR